MKLTQLVRGKVGTVIAVGAIAALAGAGTSVAASKITSEQIKDGTIQTKDLTKNNFAKFTATENVVSATTPVSAVPAYGGARVVAVNGANTPLVTLILDKGTWQISGVAQFWHIGPAPVAAPDYGSVTIPGLLERLRHQLDPRRPRRRHQRRTDVVRRDDQDHRQRHPDRHHGLLHRWQHRPGRRLGPGDAVRLREAVQERAADLT